MASGIYQITNSINGKVYIGSAENLADRKRKHFELLRRNKHVNTHLQNSFNKHGENCFIHTVLHYCDIDMLIVFEQYFIDDYSVNRLYNLRVVAESNRGIKASEETRKKISLASTGRKHTIETRAKMSLVQKGRIVSDESRIRMSIGQTGNKHSEETRAKMSLAQQARRAKETSLNL